MAVTARTRQLISEQQKTNKRRRAISSLKDFSAMFLALKDRKRAIEKEEEELRFRLTEAERRQTRFEKGLATDKEIAEANREAAQARLELQITAADQRSQREIDAAAGRQTSAQAHDLTKKGLTEEIVRSKEWIKNMQGGAEIASMQGAVQKISARGVRAGQIGMEVDIREVLDGVLFGEKDKDGDPVLVPSASGTAFVPDTGLIGAFPRDLQGAMRVAYVEKFIEVARGMGYDIDKATEMMLKGEARATGSPREDLAPVDPFLEKAFEDGFVREGRPQPRRSRPGSNPGASNPFPR
jgi:dsDNA-specific endonuclease/ATPase MutS2